MSTQSTGLAVRLASSAVGQDLMSTGSPEGEYPMPPSTTDGSTGSGSGTGGDSTVNKPNRGRNAANLTQGITFAKVMKDAFTTAGTATVTTTHAPTAAQATGWFGRTGLGRLCSKLASVTGVRAVGVGLGRICAVAGAAVAAIDIYQDFQKEDKTDAYVNLGLSVAGAAAAVGIALLMATGPVGWLALGLVACTGFGLGNLANRFGGGFIAKNAWGWLTA